MVSLLQCPVFSPPCHPRAGGDLPLHKMKRAGAEECAGTRTRHAAIPLYFAPSISDGKSASRQGGEEPPGPVRTAPAERRALARQRERKLNSPQAQPSPYQGGEEPPGPVRTAPAERRPKADSVSEYTIPPNTNLSACRLPPAA